MGRLSSLRQLEIARANVERQRKGKWSNLSEAETSTRTTTTTLAPKETDVSTSSTYETKPLMVEEPARNIGDPIMVSEPNAPIAADSTTLEAIKDPIAPTNVTVEVNAPSTLEPNLPSGGGGGFGGGFGGGASSGDGKATKKKSYKFIWIGVALVGGYLYLKNKK